MPLNAASYPLLEPTGPDLAIACSILSVVSTPNATGTPAINIAVPTRYLHSHNGVISMSDFDQTVQLITALMQKMNSDEIKTIRQFI